MAEVQVDGTFREAHVVTLWGVRTLVGRIYGDRRGRFPDGHEVHTSRIKRGKRGDPVVTTRNSTYAVEWAPK